MKSIKHIVLCSLLVTVGGSSLFSQDWHFSQYTKAPLLINPAAAGSFQGDYRANANYKNQWSSVGSAFRTMAFSYDMPVLRNYNGYKSTGAGISFFRDVAGKSGYGFTQVNLSISQGVGVSRFQELSIGLSVGYGQVSANLSNLRWDNQYNGVEYDPNLPSLETTYLPKSTYLDFAAGGLLRIFSDSREPTESAIGFSVSHLTRPWSGTLSEINNDNLQMKYILHGRTEIPFGRYADPVIIPNAMVAIQGASTEIIAGVNIKGFLGISSQYTNYFNRSYYLATLKYRYRDAIIVGAGYEWNDMLQATISYDVNFSTLSAASKSRGGIELSLVWQGDFISNSRTVKTVRGGRF